MDKINLKAVLLQNMGEDSADFLPIMGDEKELLNDNMQIPDTLPILPLRNTVLFPGVIIPINIGRDKSLKLIKDSYRQSALIGVVAQKDTNTENPDINDLYQIGKISLKKEEGVPENDPEYNAIAESLKDMASKIVKYSSHIPNEAGFALKNIESMLFLINFISSNTDVDYQNKQELLEIDNLKQRAIKLLEILSKQVSLLELKNDIQKKVKMDIDKQQREYFLHQQMKTIQDELGGNPTDEEIKELEELAETKEWNGNVREIFNKELNKLKRLNPSSPDYSVQSNYLREMLDLPWNHLSEDNLDLEHARQVLDADHFGLEKVKDLYGCLEVDCTMNRKSGDTGRPISELCRDESFRVSKKQELLILFSFWMRSIKWVTISGGILNLPCWKCSTRNKTAVFTIIFWTSTMICRK